MSRKSQHLSPKPRQAAGTPFRTNLDAGLRCLNEKRFADAIGFLDAALNAEPDDVSALSNLGLALSAVGRLDEALRAYDRAIAGSPNLAALHYNRANVLQSQGCRAEAVLAYDRALALRPAFEEALANRGNALREMGRNEDALASYERALRVNPLFVEALFNKAILLDQIGRPREALAAFDNALSVDGKSARGYLLRAGLLKRLGKPESALRDFTKATRADPRHAIAHALRGDQLNELGRHDEALKSFVRATEADPGFAEAHDRLGCALVDVGRIEEARRAHERAVALSPHKPGFYYNLTAVAELSADDPKFLAMTRMAGDTKSLAAEDEIPLRFALFNAYSDQGNYKAAFRHLRLGNALKRARIEYDEPATLSNMEHIRSLFSARLLSENRGNGHPSATPIFVLGMPRSGSTLIEQILASHPSVLGAGEIADFVAAAVEIAGDGLRDMRADDSKTDAFGEQLRRIGANYVNRIQARYGKAERIVNKMPDNFRLAGLIHLALPNARIIHTRRDPVDTCLSCYSKPFSMTVPYAYDLGELGRYYRSYDRLTAHWRTVIPPEALLEIQYEDLVADPKTHARRLVEHCGLQWDDRCLDFHRTVRPVRTASAVQVRKPIYTDAVAKWSRFADNLSPLIAALGPSAPSSAREICANRSLWERLRTTGARLWG
jgi:tetratricopeptide (TPR) repeat protein